MRFSTTTYEDQLRRVTVVTYVYDAAGVANSKGKLTSVSSSVSTYSYSAYDATGKVLGGTQTIGSQTYSLSYGYDLSGHVKTMTYPSGRTVNYSYDNAGRSSSFTGNLGDGTNRNYSTGITYDAGNLTTDTYSAAAVTRVYDAENRMTSEMQASSYVAGSYTYDGDGRRVKRIVGGTETWQVYGLGGELLAEYSATNPSPASPQKEYGYRNGQLLITAEAATASAPEPTGLAANPPTSGANVTLNWTAASGATNYRVERKAAGGSFASIGTTSSTTITDSGASSGSAYLYKVCAADGSANCTSGYSNIVLGARFNFPTDTTITTIADDPTGFNVTTMKVEHITELRSAVNAVRSLAGLSAATWAHPTLTRYVSEISKDDVQELRTKLDEALTALGIQTSAYDDSTLNGAPNGTLIKGVHIRQLRQRATSGTGGAGGGGGTTINVRWLVSDQLGTPRMIFDQSGSLATVNRHDYLPFGEELFAGTGGRTTAQGYTNSDGARQKFTSKERDNETGLDYFGARYYSSQQGRFTSVDPSRKSIIPTNPQTWNRYSYTYNNPLVMVDNNGKWPTGTHKEIIEKAFRTLDPKLVRHIQRGSEMVDRLGVASPRTLYEKNAPQHAMTPGHKVRELGSVEKAREWARNEATNFINSNMAQAKEYYEKSNQADREVTKQLFTVGAFEAFGKGAHPIMDGPAPGHHDFQVYDTQGYKLLGALSPLLGAGVFGVDMLVHSNAEGRKPTDAEMNQMVDDLRMQFLNAFGREAYERAVPEADRKETDERKRKQRQ